MTEVNPEYAGAVAAARRWQDFGWGAVTAYERLQVETARYLGAHTAEELADSSGVPAESIHAFVSEVYPGPCSNHAMTVANCEKVAGVIGFLLLSQPPSHGGGFLFPAALAHLSHHQAPSVQKPCRPQTPEPQVPQVMDGVQSRAALPRLTPPHNRHSPAALDTRLARRAAGTGPAPAAPG